MKVLIFNQPSCTPDPKNNFDILNNDYKFEIDGLKYWIPSGFQWDGASVPRAFWSIIGAPSEDDFKAASLVHDWLYLTHQTNRQDADECLFQILEQCDVSLWRRRCIWLAVRGFASGHWPSSLEDIKYITKLNLDLYNRIDSWKYGYPLKVK